MYCEVVNTLLETTVIGYSKSLIHIVNVNFDIAIKQIKKQAYFRSSRAALRIIIISMFISVESSIACIIRKEKWFSK